MGGLYTPAVRRVRKTYFHHSYNYETKAYALFLVTQTGTCVYLAANAAATTGDVSFNDAATQMETDTAAADIAADAAAADNTGYSLDKEDSKGCG